MGEGFFIEGNKRKAAGKFAAIVMKTEKYTEQVKRLPVEGKQIIAAKNGDEIIVY